MKTVLIVSGLIIAAVAIIDMLNIPTQFPTSNNTANLVIGGALIASPFVFRGHLKG